MLEKYGNFAFGGFAAVFLLGISVLVFTVFNKMVLSGENVIFGLLLISFIIFAVLTLVYVFLNESLKEKKAKIKPDFKNELEKRDTARLLEDKPFERVPASVTEGTTELLYAEKRKITDELG
jgi:hypothetical protein